jgi:hypothetical protein
MNANTEAWAELFRQLAFTSALVGGFAFAFLGVLLTATSPSRVVGWTAGVSMTAAAGMVVCVLGWTLGASTVAIEAAKATTPDSFRVPGTFLRVHLYLSQVFLSSLLLFLVGLGLSGWVRSRALGVVSTLVAALAILASILVLLPFVH